jgi:anti-anti-sigma factor
MKVKIDTKEKFHIIDLQEPVLYANMTEEMDELLRSYLKKDIMNVVLKLKDVKEIDEQIAKTIFNIQQAFYDNNASFVICEIRKPVEEMFDKLELLEFLNITPTSSEAGDIVQMEEIEREFLE